VFVTTHFLEEADFCDWVSFIDAGRLIADAPPETLRERYSEGYRIELELPGADGAPVALPEPLAGAGRRVEGANRVEISVPALDPGVLEAIARLVEERPGSAVRIHPAPMNDVFRRILAGKPGGTA
ncbi:MAG: hypothetical protein ACREQY_15670, partial [Candidatus Binatia bacterium]